MNWKWMGAAGFGIVVGLAIAPFEHRAVSAAPLPESAHFQIQSAVVDESNGEAQDASKHEVFLLDTETGKIWKFQGLEWGRDKDGSSKVFAPPVFVPVTVEQPAK